MSGHGMCNFHPALRTRVSGRWAKIGYLEQEPKLLEDKTVRENIETAVADTRALLNRCGGRRRRPPPPPGRLRRAPPRGAGLAAADAGGMPGGTRWPGMGGDARPHLPPWPVGRGRTARAAAVVAA